MEYMGKEYTEKEFIKPGDYLEYNPPTFLEGHWINDEQKRALSEAHPSESEVDLPFP